MTDLVTATVVTATGGDWQGLYIGGESAHQNHSVSITDTSLDEDTAIANIESERANLNILLINSLPKTLDELHERQEFAEKVEENPEKWEEIVEETFEEHDDDYIMTDEAGPLFGVSVPKGKTLIALLKKQSYRSEKTYLGRDSILEIDKENSESGTAAYRLKQE